MATPPWVRRVLLPGTRVLARGRDTWQLGIDPDTSARFRRTDVLDRVLASLEAGEAVAEDAASRAALVALERHVVETTTLPTTDLPPAEVSAVLERGPERATARLQGRALARLCRLGSLGTETDALIGSLLGSAGVAVVDTAESGTIGLALSVGELSRDRLDPWLRRGLPHLVVRLVDGTVTVGPFVVPGETACLRCIDSHLSVADPLYPALVEQHAEDPRAGFRHDGLAAPVDRTLLSLAAAWAVRDVTTYAEGDRPTSWSATLRFEAGLAGLTDTVWLRAGTCGCAWVSDTMAE